jgi:AcrR family transcriptional regulator
MSARATAALLPFSAATDDTRGRILVGALELFAARGFHGTSIRDISAAAGLSSASLYSHFPTKEAVLAELVLLGHEEHHRRLLSAMLASGPDPCDQLVAIMRAHVLAHTEFSLLGTVSNTELRHLSASAAGPSLALRRRSEAMVTEVIERGIRDGGFDVIDVDATTRAIATLGSGVANWWPGWQGALDASGLAEAFSELVRRMVGAA